MAKQVTKTTKPAATLAAALAAVPAQQPAAPTAQAATNPLAHVVPGARYVAAAAAVGVAHTGFAAAPTGATTGKRQKLVYAQQGNLVLVPGKATTGTLKAHAAAIAQAMAGAPSMGATALRAALCAQNSNGGRVYRQSIRAGLLVTA